MLREAGRAAPLVTLLALAIGAVVTSGAHLSNAYPSEKAPYGWPGPSSFENAVAMARSDLVLATSLPAIVLGALALRHRDPAWHGPRALMRTYTAHAAMLVAGVAVGALLGSWGADVTVPDAWLGFFVAHSVLALSFHALGFLWASWLRERALFAALATWLAIVGLYDHVVRTMLFRSVGYHGLVAGDFPEWFWIAQAGSPLTAYRGILILWRERFRDAIERAALGGAELPAWLTPATMVALALVLWVALPVGLALRAWRRRARVARFSRLRTPEPG